MSNTVCCLFGLILGWLKLYLLSSCTHFQNLIVRSFESFSTCPIKLLSCLNQILGKQNPTYSFLVRLYSLIQERTRKTSLSLDEPLSFSTQFSIYDRLKYWGFCFSRQNLSKNWAFIGWNKEWTNRPIEFHQL